ncbi:Mitochondrial N(5)-glutamine methyltransferase, partial [Lachnellula suecica]
MPRIPHHLLHRAHAISPLLPLIIKGTRCLESAQNELRWLREHVLKTHPKPSTIKTRSKALYKLCKRRSRAEPLQYILGSQPFGELDIKCKPGVLIPRPETEAYTTHLAALLKTGTLHKELSQKLRPQYGTTPLKILDLCTGTGCIPLLLYSLLHKHFPSLEVHGWDISPLAINLAVENLRRNDVGIGDSKPSPVQFDKVDIFAPFNQKQKKTLRAADIIISNPPYISPTHFQHATERSVRLFEPKLALVPPPSLHPSSPTSDIFYVRLLHIFTRLSRAEVLLMEVGDEAQAWRVVKLALGA